MKTYEITFRRENGTTGTDRFTAATEAQARRDFNACYRHGNGTITNVEVVSENVPTTKEQERKALEQIKKIIESLGENSYIATAFEGCFEVAAENIENDFACSLKHKAEAAEQKAEKLEAETARYKKQIEELTKQLEQEQEWRAYEDKENVQQEDYEHLVEQGDTRYFTDEEAKDILYDWYGFAREKVVIYHSLPKYEVNRHGLLRQVGEIDRRPAYNATDWNYIRFDCGAMTYELHNDNLRFFVH